MKKLTFAVTRDENLPDNFDYLNDPRNEPKDSTEYDEEDEIIDDDSIVDRTFTQNRDLGDEFCTNEEI